MAAKTKQRLIAQGAHLTPEDFETKEHSPTETDESHLSKDSPGDFKLLLIETPCTVKLASIWPK